MRQVMPHRNNIVVRRTKSKIFFAGARRERVEWRIIHRLITHRDVE
jgi:hypothetical protein